MRFSIYEKTGFGFLAAAWLVWAVDFAGDTLVQAEPLKKAVFTAQKAAKTTTKAAPAAKADPAAAAKAASGVMAMLAAADAAAGEKTFKKCKACHSTDKGGKNLVGPNLWDSVGKAKAAGEGFKYSDALKGLGGAWSYQDMDAFLANPKTFAKGTKMSFNGLAKPTDRAAVIAYLRSLSDQPKPLP